MLLAIKSDERSSVVTGSDNNLSALDLVGIESVHWHSSLEEDIVGNINDVVDGAQTDGLESVLEPFGRLLDSHSSDGKARVAWASIGILDLDGDGLVVHIDSHI